jgi:hypothetical protein
MSERSQRAWRVGMWLLVAFAFTNALLHLRVVCWSLIASDNWNHVYPLLQDTFAGRLGLGNFLIQRAGVDHAQPLNKLVMWLNARWFGLDFRLEGYLGMAFGLAALLVLYRAMRSEAGNEPAPAAYWLAFAAVAGVFYSLNSSFIYTYSMVTMWYALYLGAFVMLLAAWHAVRGGRPWPLALAAFALGIVADDSAYLDITALTFALSLYGWRERSFARVAPALAALAVALLASRGVYWAFGETSGNTQAVFNQPLSARIAGLAAQWYEAWSWFAIPASSGLADARTLQGLVGDAAPVARQVVMLCLLGAHGWFWWAALRLRTGASWLAAVTVMMMFYAHVAAILVARVFVRGTVYLEQERYVSFYQLGIIALLLMAMVWVTQRRGARSQHAVLAAVVCVLLLQLPVTRLAKQREPGIEAHNRRMSLDMARVALDPANPPPACASGMDLCLLPPERRVLLVGLLRRHRLSLFSPQYARRHPEDAEAVRLLHAPR